jgi:hypothetical protein
MLRVCECRIHDQAAAEFHERFVNVSVTFEANAQTAEIIQPGMYTFDNSALNRT